MSMTKRYVILYCIFVSMLSVVMIKLYCPNVSLNLPV